MNIDSVTSRYADQVVSSLSTREGAPVNLEIEGDVVINPTAALVGTALLLCFDDPTYCDERSAFRLNISDDRPKRRPQGSTAGEHNVRPASIG